IKSIFIKLAYAYNIDTIPLLTLRMLLSAPFYLAILIYISKNKYFESPSISSNFYILLFLCSVGYYAASITDMFSLEYISVGLERIILFTFPLFALLFSILILKKKYKPKVIIPFAICFF